MQIGIVPDSLLFLREPALRVQVGETLRALAALRPNGQGRPIVVPFDGEPDTLRRLDALHVWSGSGVNWRILAMAAASGVPLVFSPLLVHGGAHPQLSCALAQAALIVATGPGEGRAIAAATGNPSRIRVLGNGVGPTAFNAGGDLFRQRTGLHRPFVLLAGPLAPQHQQLALARTVTAQGLAVVAIGEARDPAYLRQLQALPGVTCMDALEHDADLWRSACAAAAVLALPGQGDASARTVLDALACGTPVVLSTASPIDVPADSPVLCQVRPGDAAARARAQAVRALLSEPPSRERVRAAVRPFTWERVARRLAACYAQAARRLTPLAA